MITGLFKRLQVAERRRERGAGMVEFVIILPLLVILLFGIIEFGIVFNRVQGLHASAREGARVASLSQTTQGQINSRVTDSLNGITFDTGPFVAIAPGGNRPCLDRGGQTVEVIVTATHDLNIPFVPAQTLNLSGNGSFRCEGG